MNVYLANGQRLTLDNRDVIGSGGEGTVFRLLTDPNNVYKVYENPTVEQGKKLQAFLARNFPLSDSVAAPKLLLLNSRDHVIGFTMPFFNGAKAIRELAGRKFRNSMGISNRSVVDIMIDAGKELTEIHKLGLVVGDLNDQNLLFIPNKAKFIDVDSWQFDVWPCPVATENYLDPALYNLDLTRRPSFTPGNDWYSFAVMLFRSLLLVHPYGGTHPTIRTLPERALKRLTVFDSSVTYPAIALPAEVISEDLGNVFTRYFQKGWRDIFPIDELQKFKSALVRCPSCQSDYPSNRRQCPVCKEQNQVVVTTNLPGTVSVRQLTSFSGLLVYNKLEGNVLILIVVENGLAVMYQTDLNGTRKIPLFKYSSGMRFEASTKLLAVNMPGSEKIEVYDVSDKIKLIFTTISDMYSVTQNAVFRVFGSSLYRMIGSNLIQTEFVNGFELNTPLRPTIDNQSWFAMSTNLTPPAFAGFYRVMRQQFFWTYQNGRSLDLNLPQLEIGEGLVDLSVKFSSETIVILRKTKFKGEDFIRFDIFEKNGKVMCSTKVPIKNLPSDKIHGLAYSSGKIIFPTDVGAVRYDPVTNQANNFSATLKVVKSSQSIYPYAKGILLVEPHSISYLTMN